MTDLLISLIKIKDRHFRFTKRLIDTPTPDRCDNANSATCAQIELITAVC